MKKIIIGLCIGLTLFFMTGCGKQEKNIEGTLEEIMTKVYAGISEDELPMMLSNVEVTDGNIENYLGTKDIDYQEALASESMVGSIAHSVVLVRMNDGADIEATKTLIKEKANPAKWICVTAENVYVESKGNLIILIMSGELADPIKTNFEQLS